MKLYQNKDWLYNRYIVQKKTIMDIANECSVGEMTIQRYLDKFKLKIKR
jgi:DNA-binding MurR/RpiR family transcriptional regulator